MSADNGGRGHRRRRSPARVRPEQLRLIFGLGRARGLEIDDLRALTPAGSLSAMTAVEAGILIARLSAKPPRSGGGTATGKQLALIDHLKRTLFGPAEFAAWLERGWGVGSCPEIRDRGLARKVITALLRIEQGRSELPTVQSTRRFRQASAAPLG